MMGFIKKKTFHAPPPPSESSHFSHLPPPPSSPGGPMSCRLYNNNLSLPEMLSQPLVSQPLRLAWLQQQLTHFKIIADPNLRSLFHYRPRLVMTAHISLYEAVSSEPISSFSLSISSEVNIAFQILTFCSLIRVW